MSIITSKDNLVIKETIKLKDKKHRKEKGEFFIEGLRFVEEAINSKATVTMIFFSESFMSKGNSKDILLRASINTKTYIVKDSIFKALCSTQTPQGIAAVIVESHPSLEDKVGFYLLVDKIQDPGNMGTIIRTAHGAGALGVIATKGTVDIYNEKTLRSTMGSIFNIPIFEEVDSSLIKELQEKGFKLLASTPKADKNIYQVEIPSKVIIAVGNEGNGISSEIFELIHEKVKLPMPGNTESLNAAVAAGILMYEIVRRNA